LDPVAALLATAQAGDAHEPGDTISTMAAALLTERLLNARTAIRLSAAGKNGGDPAGELLIGQGAWAKAITALLPVVEAAGGDFKELTQSQDGVIGFHRMDPFIALGDGSERMPNVFFKMSRCSVKWRISRRAASNWICNSAAERGFAPAAAFPPASAGAKRCCQAYSRLGRIPNSKATTLADLPLESQLLTASRLKVWSNF
jgi:hypothetical protein